MLILLLLLIIIILLLLLIKILAESGAAGGPPPRPGGSGRRLPRGPGRELLYYTILYYTILYYAMLCYTILYYTILYYAMLCYAMLCSYYTILYYTILYYTILYHTIPYHTIPYRVPRAAIYSKHSSEITQTHQKTSDKQAVVEINMIMFKTYISNLMIVNVLGTSCKRIARAGGPRCPGPAPLSLLSLLLLQYY